ITALQHIENGFRHALRYASSQLVIDLVANAQFGTDLLQKLSSRFLETGYRTGVIVGNQTGSDIDRGGAFDPTALDETDFGRSSAEIDVYKRQTLLMTLEHRAGTVSSHNRFERRSGSCAYKPAGFIGENLRDFRRVIPARGFAGDNHCAGIDFLP